MYEIGNIQPYMPRWQGIVLLLTVLASRRGGMSKQDALGMIEDEDWFAVVDEDRPAYPSNLERGCMESRWKTGICWARKDALENGLLEPGQRDNWNIIAPGRDWQELVSRACHAGDLDVRRCFIWSRKFKKLMHSPYEPGNDAPRPWTLYNDWFARRRQEFYDSL